MPASRPFEIIIVGAGIAGLAAAVALKAPNRRITLLEQSRLNREVGANISLQPNAVKIAKRFLGLDSYLFGDDSIGRGVADKAFLLYGIDNKLHMRIDLETDQYGEDRICFHRVDLHNGLRQAALDSGAQIRTASRVVKVEAEAGSVMLESGEQLTADLIVGADGIRSAVRTAVIGHEQLALPTGLSAFRTLIPIESLSDIEGLPQGMQLGDSQTVMVVGRDCRLIMGPSRSGTVLGVVGLVPDTEEIKGATSWNMEASKDDFVRSYKNFPDWTLEIIRRSVEPSIWQLRDIAPLAAWHRGKAVLIGDAAHAMLPTQGQGASQSFEDAEALQYFLRDISSASSTDQVQQALAAVYAARHERASVIQAYSREQAKPGTSYNGKVTLNPREFMDYNCKYEGSSWWLAQQISKTRPSAATPALRTPISVSTS
ncbi:related to salicylate 1-monooxygenase [Ustilago trichophora]|uniref:Related to salicylate 1-monooxygenase n=1 Tax=Ustilago trichophora TaxID=86804 RepID=A0A5C3E9D6_9BASI|nr:related to salicylate 1-monooxygenase [Ustilago trichophora]